VRKLFRSLIILLIIYSIASAVMLTLSVALSARGIIADISWVFEIQRYLYSSSRNIWQNQADCVAYDEQLIYKPKNGTCEFNNLEFKTRLNFSDSGRSTGTKPEGDPIVVLGDSFAMGWGVNDDETFSARLEKITGRPIYNLAVSSYGTVRELLRLEKSGLQEKAEIIVIQYCYNDKEENVRFKIPTSSEASEKFKTIQSRNSLNSFTARFNHFFRAYKFSFLQPLKPIRKALMGDAIAFGPHYEPLMKALKKSSALKNKHFIIFYSNAYGRHFRNFPKGRDKQMPNVYFVDLELDAKDYYYLDGHLTSAGHKRIASKLAEVLKTQGR